MRWRLRLEEYEYTIEYKKGKENTAADALVSRIYLIDIVQEPELFQEIEELSEAYNETVSEYEQWKEEGPHQGLTEKINRPHYVQLTHELLLI